MPWDYIIKKTSFGVKSCEMEHWWNQHVIHPACLKPGDAHAFVAKIEGRAAHYIAPIPNTPGGERTLPRGRESSRFSPRNRGRQQTKEHNRTWPLNTVLHGARTQRAGSALGTQTTSQKYVPTGQHGNCYQPCPNKHAHLGNFSSNNNKNPKVDGQGNPVFAFRLRSGDCSARLPIRNARNRRPED